MFEIREDLIGAIVNYLGNRPYNEVYGLIEGIKQVKKIEPKPEAKEEECKDTATSAKKK
jgi:hypothetical protein